jgi:hypothetical protein
VREREIMKRKKDLERGWVDRELEKRKA